MTPEKPKGRKPGDGDAREGRRGDGHGDKHRGESPSCGLSADALQRGFDGEGGAQDVAGHVASCDPCGSALELLQTQRDAVQFLTGSAVVLPAHTAVEHILSSSARAGREKLADLLYEMAKACLIVLPDLKRRIERKVEPREVPVVSGELHSLNSRLEKADGSVTLREVPQKTPEEARALKVARNCLAILENVEGGSERQQLAWSQVLIFEGNPAEAEGVLRGLLEGRHSLQHRELALRNAMLCLIRQERFAEAINLGGDLLGSNPNDSSAMVNLAVCHAHLRQLPQFGEIAGRLGRMQPIGGSAWLESVLRFEVPRFANDLGIDKRAVEQLFGFSADAGG